MSLKYRPYLDGLRALAVLFVILYHLDLPWARGGFLGVDLFFVLSGYLITRLLIGEKERYGRIRFARFYARRAKRLLPALYALLLLVSLTGFVAFSESSRAAIDRDAFSALTYWANWSFVFHDQSYFEAFADPSPLRHMWSLSVEEQFYFVWPLLIAWLPLGTKKWPQWVVAMLVLLSAGLLAWTFGELDPSRAYYGTDTRIHEPLIGALLALRVGESQHVGQYARWLAAPGLLGIVAAATLVSDSSKLYYMGGSVGFSVLVAILLLGLEAPQNERMRHLLGLKPLVVVGRLSYSMYLWHWPIVLVLREHTDLAAMSSGLLIVATISSTLLVSYLSYRIVESPIRNAETWFRGNPLRPLHVAGVTIGIGLLVAIPSLMGINSVTKPSWADDGLEVHGEAEVRIAVIGDSVGRSLVPGYRAQLEDQDVAVIDAAMGGCSIAGAELRNENGETLRFSDRCMRRLPETLSRLAVLNPAAVVWHSRSEMNHFGDPTTGAMVPFGVERHDQLLRTGWQRAVDTLSHAQHFIVEAIPNGPRNPTRCKTDPLCGADDDKTGRLRHFNELARKFAEEQTRVTFVPLAHLVCPSGPPCLDRLGDRNWRHDGFHYTEEGARLVAEEVLANISLGKLRTWARANVNRECPLDLRAEDLRAMRAGRVGLSRDGSSATVFVENTEDERGWAVVNLTRLISSCTGSYTHIAVEARLVKTNSTSLPTYFYLGPTKTKRRFTEGSGPLVVELAEIEQAGEEVRLSFPVAAGARYGVVLDVRLTK